MRRDFRGEMRRDFRGEFSGRPRGSPLPYTKRVFRATARVAPTIYEQDSLNYTSYRVGATLAVALKILTSILGRANI